MAYEFELEALSLIRKERDKQISLGFTLDHDEDFTAGELARAAAFFALPGPIELGDGKLFPEYMLTPEFQDSPKMNRSTWPEGDIPRDPGQLRSYAEFRLRDLAKAGACVLAEMQRLQRLGGIEDPESLPEALNPAA